VGQWGVKWIYQQVQAPHGAKLEAGQKPSLCFKGREWMLCVIAAHPVRLVKRPAKDFDKVRDVVHNGKEYGVLEAASKFKEIADRNGITIGASKLLDRAMQEATVVDEDQFNDEEELKTMQESVIKDPENGTTTVAAETETKEQVDMSSKKKSAPKGKKAAKAEVAKKATAPKKNKGPSKISQAVEFMAAEVKKAGGQAKLERGFRKELFEKAAKKFDLSPITCSIQYNKQVLNG
jgi:hypothetical protein